MEDGGEIQIRDGLVFLPEAVIASIVEMCDVEPQQGLPVEQWKAFISQMIHQATAKGGISVLYANLLLAYLPGADSVEDVLAEKVDRQAASSALNQLCQDMLLEGRSTESPTQSQLRSH